MTDEPQEMPLVRPRALVDRVDRSTRSGAALLALPDAEFAAELRVRFGEFLARSSRSAALELPARLMQAERYVAAAWR